VEQTMTNNDILRRIRYIFDFNDKKLINNRGQTTVFRDTFLIY